MNGLQLAQFITHYTHHNAYSIFASFTLGLIWQRPQKSNSFNAVLCLELVPERNKVRHRGIGDESRARALRADQGLYTQNESEQERARVCQRVAVRASESQSGSHREP